MRFCVRIGTDSFELAQGANVIGRDRGAHITVIDTLVSRSHAQIVCQGPDATLEDLESRNGTRLNGVAIAEPRELRDGDRVSVGSYDLTVVLLSTEDARDLPRGAVHVCPSCRAGYLAERGRCPSCGASKSAPPPSQEIKLDPDTSLERWSLDALIDALRTSIAAGRVLHAEKLMREVAIVTNAHLDARRPVSAQELAALGEATAWLARAQISPAWSDWFAEMEGRLRAL